MGRMAELAGLYVDRKGLSKNGHVLLTLPAEFCPRLSLGMKFPVMADVDVLFPDQAPEG